MRAFDEELAATGACSIDHDGCVVCLDSGIPVRVVAVEGCDALCTDVAGNEVRVAVELVMPVSLGEVLVMHGGVAIAKRPAGAFVAREEADA